MMPHDHGTPLPQIMEELEEMEAALELVRILERAHEKRHPDDDSRQELVEEGERVRSEISEYKEIIARNIGLVHYICELRLVDRLKLHAIAYSGEHPMVANDLEAARNLIEMHVPTDVPLLGGFNHEL